MEKIITISRMFGSGGKEIGQKLAKELNIPFYDNEIITKAAKETGFAEAAFEHAEDKATNSLLYSIAMGMNVFANQETGFSGLSLDDRIFLAQSNVIRNVAKEGPCVIVGRCADYVLRDLDNTIDVFIYAGLDFRINRAIDEYNVSPTNAGEEVIKHDKRRANYYRYHSGDKWGVATNYDLAIRSDYGGIDHTVKCIKNYIET